MTRTIVPHGSHDRFDVRHGLHILYHGLLCSICSSTRARQDNSCSKLTLGVGKDTSSHQPPERCYAKCREDMLSRRVGLEVCGCMFESVTIGHAQKSQPGMVPKTILSNAWQKFRPLWSS